MWVLRHWHQNQSKITLRKQRNADTKTIVNILTRSTKFWFDSGMYDSPASCPHTNSKRKTPKLYTSLFSENCLNSFTLLTIDRKIVDNISGRM